MLQGQPCASEYALGTHATCYLDPCLVRTEWKAHPTCANVTQRPCLMRQPFTALCYPTTEKWGGQCTHHVGRRQGYPTRPHSHRASPACLRCRLHLLGSLLGLVCHPAVLKGKATLTGQPVLTWPQGSSRGGSQEGDHSCGLNSGCTIKLSV